MEHLEKYKTLPIFIEKDALCEEKFIELNKNESHHALNVLRMKINDKMVLIDGKGTIVIGEISKVFRFYCSIYIIKKYQYEKSNKRLLHIAISPLKIMTRFEWFIEKATEIGVDRISPIICKRTERQNIQIDRLEKKMFTAVKQSRKLIFPEILPPKPYDEFIMNVRGENKFIAHCNIGHKESLKTIVTNNFGDSLVCIGPEGDFTLEEIRLAEKYRFTSIHLGKERLRSETAGLLSVLTFYDW